MSSPDAVSGPDPVGDPVPDRARPPARRLLVVPSPDPVRLARACAGLGAQGHVVPTGAGCVVVLDPAVDVDAALPRLSRVLGRAPVLLLRSDGGQVEAQRWARGVPADVPQAGLVVSALPDVVHALLVGSTDAADLPGSVRTGLRPRPTALTGPAVDPGRAARRRRSDRVAAVVVAVAAALLVVVEAVRVATADGSRTVVVLAALVAVGMGVLALRLRPLPERPVPPPAGAEEPSPGSGDDRSGS